MFGKENKRIKHSKTGGIPVWEKEIHRDIAGACAGDLKQFIRKYKKHVLKIIRFIFAI